MDYAERKEEEAKDAGKGRKIKEKGFQILDEAMCLLMLGMAGLVGMEANILIWYEECRDRNFVLFGAFVYQRIIAMPIYAVNKFVLNVVVYLSI